MLPVSSGCSDVEIHQGTGLDCKRGKQARCDADNGQSNDRDGGADDDGGNGNGNDNRKNHKNGEDAVGGNDADNAGETTRALSPQKRRRIDVPPVVFVCLCEADGGADCTCFDSST